MHVLFDNGTPRGVAAALSGHIVEEARSRGWDMLRNGELLDAAEAARVRRIRHDRSQHPHQQNLTGRRIAVVVLGSGRWRLIRNKLLEIAAAVATATPGSLMEIEIPVE